MYKFQLDRGATARRRKSAVTIAVLCLVLLALISVLQVAHVHQTASDADHCQLCIALHAAAPVAVAAAVVVLVQLGSCIPVFAFQAAIRPWCPSRFTRPPPMGC